MATIRILLGIFCFAVIGIGNEPSSSILGAKSEEQGARINRIGIQTYSLQHTTSTSKTIRNAILNIASSQIGVKEATGNNDGVQVEAYLRVTKLAKGSPWCAAFISWVFKQVGYAGPITPWSPALFPLAKQTLAPQRADVYGIYSIELKRIAHCGILERRQHNWIIGIEGNTNLDGSRDGNGVYRKWRHVRTIAKFADWVR